MVFGIPISLLLVLAGFLAGASAPFLIAAYHRLIKFVYAKTGVTLPDNPAIDADIEAVVKALLPLLLSEAVSGKLDPQALIKAIEDAVKAANPAADVSAVASAVASVDPKFAVPGLR